MTTTLFSNDWSLQVVGEEAAAAKLASLPTSAKRPRGNRAGKNTSNAGHVKTTDAQREALVRNVESACFVAGAVAVGIKEVKSMLSEPGRRGLAF